MRCVMCHVTCVNTSTSRLSVAALMSLRPFTVSSLKRMSSSSSSDEREREREKNQKHCESFSFSFSLLLSLSFSLLSPSISMTDACRVLGLMTDPAPGFLALGRPNAKRDDLLSSALSGLTVDIAGAAERERERERERRMRERERREVCAVRVCVHCVCALCVYILMVP